MIMTPDHELTREHMIKIHQLANENYTNHIAQCNFCKHYELEDGQEYTDQCEEGYRLACISGGWLERILLSAFPGLDIDHFIKVMERKLRMEEI